MSLKTITIKGLKECSTTIKISNASINTVDGMCEDRGVACTSGAITVKAQETTQPSNNNGGNNTPSQTTNNNSSNNNTSNNNNNNKTNTDNQNLEIKKNGSSNNLLSSLSVAGFTLDKKFNANTTSYSISVKSDVNSISVKATSADSKAKVTVFGANALKSGKNTVSVVVTAENGSKKTYNIIVNKEADPNAPVEEPQQTQPEVAPELSGVNTLENIELNVGTLSPVFDKEKTKYIVYLPFEVEGIDITPILTDDKASYKISKDDALKVGDNKYTITVTAENGEIKKYVVIVRRGFNPEYIDNNNTYLKSLSIKNGKLITKFDKKTQVYYYSGKNINIDAIAEDESAIVDISKEGDTYFVKVEVPNGQYRIYTLKPYKFYNALWFEITLFVVGLITGYILRIIYKKWRSKAKKKKNL